MSAPYAGRHAELYDLFYADKPYADQAEWISSMLLPGSSVLDVACGTGGHSLALSRHGHRVVGVDLSESMVVQARLKADGTASSACFSVGDMRALPIRTAFFDAAVCLFDSIGYVLTDDGVRAALTEFRRVLKPGGLLVMEFWNEPVMVTRFSPVRVRRWTTESGSILRISETEILPESHLARVSYSVLELLDDGTFSEFSETQMNRFFSTNDMGRLLAEARFDPFAWLGGFSEYPVTEDTWHVVSLARAA
jgi:ubiquinone/menaquinone biosynthesis C-methylase UbiE